MPSEVLNNAKKEVYKWVEFDEIMWKQRTQVEWVREGDKNMRYFNAKALAWRRNFSIKRLQSNLGVWKEGEQVEALIIDYFKSLFLASNTTGILEFLLGLKGCVIESMNVELSKEYTSEEVYQALMQMHPTSAPGLDKLSAVFFQWNWQIVGELTTKSILSSLHKCEFPPDLNLTFISLIPKNFHPTKIS